MTCLVQILFISLTTWQGKVPQEQERESATETLKRKDFQNWKIFDKEYKLSMAILKDFGVFVQGLFQLLLLLSSHCTM